MKRCIGLYFVLCLLGVATQVAAQEIVTILGTGEAGWSGDGGPGTAAKCGSPFGVVIGPDGALYVCETTTHVIRRVDLETQQVSTILGTGGKSGHAGDGGPAALALLNEPYEVRFDRDGHLFIVEMLGAVVRRLDSRTGHVSTVAGTAIAGFSGDGGPAARAQLKQPHSIALDNNGQEFRVTLVDDATQEAA